MSVWSGMLWTWLLQQRSLEKVEKYSPAWYRPRSFSHLERQKKQNSQNFLFCHIFAYVWPASGSGVLLCRGSRCSPATKRWSYHIAMDCSLERSFVGAKRSVQDSSFQKWTVAFRARSHQQSSWSQAKNNQPSELKFIETWTPPHFRQSLRFSTAMMDLDLCFGKIPWAATQHVKDFLKP